MNRLSKENLPTVTLPSQSIHEPKTADQCHGMAAFLSAKSGQLTFLLSLGFLALLTVCIPLSGCSTSSSQFQDISLSKTNSAEPLLLREGDTVKIEFPGAPNLNTREQIKRDGKIALLVGEVTAAGKTLPELQKEIADLYAPQLVTKVVIVSLESSVFPYYVTGAVSKPGRLNSDRPLTALEGIMEAGVDLTKANLKSVRVTRSLNGKTSVYMLDLDRVLKGKDPKGKPFYLVPSDIVYVPEKFQWF
ncbi:MAG: polysaccharide biosynthesis/export family protein [Verrucomicrobiota bacterium]